MSLSDSIQNFIIDVIGDSNEVTISRMELAKHFSCVPSQINYVLATRFTFDRGFTYETKRGNGGFIKIIRLEYDKNCYINELITNIIPSEISYNRASGVIDTLIDKDMLDKNVGEVMKSALNDNALTMPISIKDSVRANILKSMLKQCIK